MERVEALEQRVQLWDEQQLVWQMLSWQLLVMVMLQTVSWLKSLLE